MLNCCLRVKRDDNQNPRVAKRLMYEMPSLKRCGLPRVARRLPYNRVRYKDLQGAPQPRCSHITVCELAYRLTTD